MVRKGEILSQAVSGVGDDILEGAKELFEKSESELEQAQNVFAVKKRRAARRVIYSLSAVAAAACIFIVLGTGLIPIQGNGRVPKVYYDGVRIDSDGYAVGVQAQEKPDVAVYSLERSIGQGEEEFALNVKARGSFIIEASSGEFMPDGTDTISVRDEADIVWAVVPTEGAYITVNTEKETVKIELHQDEESGQWMLRTGE